MSEREGPRLTIDASCYGCVHVRSECYRVQGDSGCNVSCTHPDGKGSVGETTWRTPKWCPLLQRAMAALLAEHERGSEP